MDSSESGRGAATGPARENSPIVAPAGSSESSSAAGPGPAEGDSEEARNAKRLGGGTRSERERDPCIHGWMEVLCRTARIAF